MSRTFASRAIFPWLVSAWGAGVLGFAVRLIGGWLSIQWLARHGTKPVRESWAEPLGRLKKRLKLARGFVCSNQREFKCRWRWAGFSR